MCVGTPKPWKFETPRLIGCLQSMSSRHHCGAVKSLILQRGKRFLTQPGGIRNRGLLTPTWLSILIFPIGPISVLSAGSRRWTNLHILRLAA